ncbi:17-beta-hydroxysteroid dehydrogenase 14-like [Sphaerodactylus townsendi]|uniref:17-beta-hydroxysteroid dehydrogenase 14-like n=1 Tax=Sphaerodactylus townsendi TaxID=933632 RepID=UPI0020274B23|nr:17-beta-hydroxysteroid dehydrogenase 14-like [Sphaerodactylus townsendi]
MAIQLRYPGKVVIVTGGTSGIGLATVREFARHGANVVFCSKPSEAEVGRAIQRELQTCGCAGDACFQVCDMHKEGDIQKLIGATIERYGCLDCLVNNAGDGHPEIIDDLNAQDFNNFMELNAVGSMLAAKYALPYLRETRGNIINISGLSGVGGGKHLLSYSSSKGAILAMTKTLAIDESKYGVRVNSISPGFVWTPLYERYVSFFPDPEAKIQEDKCCQLLGRLGTAEEVALAVLFLAADGTFCTGANLVVSGGADVGFGIKNLMELEPGHCAKVNLKSSSTKK